VHGAPVGSHRRATASALAAADRRDDMIDAGAQLGRLRDQPNVSSYRFG
jgi:hypothetical protein